jgi:hypothetical protein
MNARNEELIKRFASHSMRKQIEAALTAAEKMADRATEIRNNRLLSDQGRDKEIRAQVRSALRDIRDAAAPLTEMKARLAGLVASIKPVSFPKDDLAGALLRQEMRAALKTMPIGDRAALLLGGEKADAAWIDSMLEAPARLSGVVEPEIYERAREQRLESLFAEESAEVERLTDQIAEAEAGMEIARGDLSRAAGLPPHEFAKMVDHFNSRKDAPWLKRFGEDILVVRPGEGLYPPASAEELRDGVYYKDYQEYLAARAA